MFPPFVPAAAIFNTPGMNYASGPELIIIALIFSLYFWQIRSFFTVMLRVHSEYMHGTLKVNDGHTLILREKLINNQLKILLYRFFAPDQFAVSRYEAFNVKLRQFCYAAGEKFHIPAGKISPPHAHVKECIS